MAEQRKKRSSGDPVAARGRASAAAPRFAAAPRRAPAPQVSPATPFLPTPARQPTALASRYGSAPDPLPMGDVRSSGRPLPAGLLGLLVLVLVFVAYAVNLGGSRLFADSLFDFVNQSAHSKNDAAVTVILAAFPYLLGVFVLLVLVAAVRGLTGKGKQVRQSVKLRGRGEVSLEDFMEDARVHGVSAKVAREAYRLLAACCSDCMRAHMDDNLQRDLQLRRSDVTNLYAAIARKSDRFLKAADMVATYTTVLDLLLAVEEALPRSALRPAERNPPGGRLPSLVRPAVRPAEPYQRYESYGPGDKLH